MTDDGHYDSFDLHWSYIDNLQPGIYQKDPKHLAAQKLSGRTFETSGRMLKHAAACFKHAAAY